MNVRVILTAMIVIGSAGLTRADNKPPVPMDPQAKAFADWQQQIGKMFDTNGDGKLSDQEKLLMAEAMRRQGINPALMPGGPPGSEQFMKLSDEEKLKALAMMQRMRGHNGMHGGVRAGGGGGSGFMPQPVMPVAPQANGNAGKLSPYANRFDKDGDGKLSDDEKSALQAEAKKKDGKDTKKDKPKK